MKACKTQKSAEEEECPKEEEAKASPNCEALYHLEKFSNYLVEALNKIPNLHDEWMRKFLKVGEDKRKTLAFSVPRWRKWEGCYASYMWLLENTKISMITRFGSRKFIPANYVNVEVKRNERRILLLTGYTLFHYKGKGFVMWSNYDGMDSSSTLHYNEKHEKLAVEIIEGMRTYMQEKSFYKNERIKVSGGYFFEFLEYPKLSWKDIVLSEKITNEIMLNLVFPLNNEQICKDYKVPWRRGVLLGGEPGTGKTKLAKVLCNMLDHCTIIWVTSESIGKSEHIASLFEAARFLAPTLIVMEDIDFFGQDREIVHNPIVGELLNQLDGNAPNDGIFVMASSNRPGLLDKALANRPGRFDVKLEVTLPEEPERLRMVRLFSKDRKFSSEVRVEHLATITNGLTGAHIQEAFIYATLDSLNRGLKSIDNTSIEKAVARMKSKDVPRMVS